jgi:hypothetical protein
VELIVTERSVASSQDDDAHSLAAIAEHPNAAIRSADRARKIADAAVIAEVERGSHASTWATADHSAVAPNQSWGRSEQPLIFGQMEYREMGKVCSPSSLRPSPPDIGDLELSIQGQLDGSTNSFGTRFWSLLCSRHAATRAILTKGAASVTRISYRDRYLLSPLTISLLHQVIFGLKDFLGTRYGAPEVMVTTTGKRQETARAFTPKVFPDWPDTKTRDRVAGLVLNGSGNLTFSASDSLQHSRQLRVEFSSGEVLGVRFDQGVGYWRVSSRSRPGSKGAWFDFGNSDIECQAERIKSLDVELEGQFAPTQIFVTFRPLDEAG